MNVMIDCSNYGSWICKLMSSERIFVPSALEVVQLVVKVLIINVELVWIDANDGTYIWRMSLDSLYKRRRHVTQMIHNRSWG